MEVDESKRNVIQGDALEMIRHGRFGPISIGSSLAEVRDFLSPIEGLEPDHLITYDADVEDTWAFAFSSLRFYLKKKYDGDFNVSAIVVDSLIEYNGFLDDGDHIFFKCHGLRNKIKIQKIKRRLNNMGISVVEQKTVAYSVELHTHPYGALVFNFYPPEGVFEHNATFSQFVLK